MPKEAGPTTHTTRLGLIHLHIKKKLSGLQSAQPIRINLHLGPNPAPRLAPRAQPILFVCQTQLTTFPLAFNYFNVKPNKPNKRPKYCNDKIICGFLACFFNIF